MNFRVPIIFLFIFVSVSFVLFPPTMLGQQADSDITIDAATRRSVIENLLNEIDQGYVFPEIAKRMGSDVKQRLSANEFEDISSAKAFAEKLTSVLQGISRDKHLRVRYSHSPLPVRKEQGEPTAAERERNRWFMKRMNFGFEKVERMNGNIGYIDLRGFSDHEAGADTVAAAMSFLSNTEALIFDLRQNGGGNPFMVALISSYLFGDKPVHLNDLYWRKGDRTDQFWTKPESARIKFPDKDVYILTSNYTFSAGEEFTYNLKNLKRATIVGETTGGGAHPGGMVRLHDHFGVFIPTGRAINPISKTNWEGTGVEPDIKVSKEQALKTAYLMALNRSAASTTDEQVKNGIKDLIAQTQRELEEMKSKK